MCFFFKQQVQFWDRASLLAWDFWGFGIVLNRWDMEKASKFDLPDISRDRNQKLHGISNDHIWMCGLSWRKHVDFTRAELLFLTDSFMAMEKHREKGNQQRPFSLRWVVDWCHDMGLYWSNVNPAWWWTTHESWLWVITLVISMG